MTTAEIRAALENDDPARQAQQVGIQLMRTPIRKALISPDPEDFSEILSYSFAIADEISKEVRLLPWSDRASWHRVRKNHAAYATEDLNMANYIRTTQAGNPYHNLRERYDPLAQFIARREFEEHLERRLRPNLLRRLRSARYTMNLMRKGPWSV